MERRQLHTNINYFPFSSYAIKHSHLLNFHYFLIYDVKENNFSSFLNFFYILQLFFFPLSHAVVTAREHVRKENRYSGHINKKKNIPSLLVSFFFIFFYFEKEKKTKKKWKNGKIRRKMRNSTVYQNQFLISHPTTTILTTPTQVITKKYFFFSLRYEEI